MSKSTSEHNPCLSLVKIFHADTLLAESEITIAYIMEIGVLGVALLLIRIDVVA